MNIKQFMESTLDIREGVPFCIKERTEEDYEMPKFYVYENDKIYDIDNKEKSDPDVFSKILKGEVFVYRQPKSHIYELHNMFNMKYNKKYALYKNNNFSCYVRMTHEGICLDDLDVELPVLLEEICSSNVEIREMQMPEKGQLYFYIENDGKIKSKIFENDAIDVAMKVIENIFLDEATAKLHQNTMYKFLQEKSQE